MIMNKTPPGENARDALTRNPKAEIERRIREFLDGLKSPKALFRAFRKAARPDRENAHDPSGGGFPYRESDEPGIAALRDSNDAIGGESDVNVPPSDGAPVKENSPEYFASFLKEPCYIAPLDDNYIPMKRAAALIAGERSGIDADDVMETLKHALFTGELERLEPADERNVPLMRIEAPPTRWAAAPRLPIDLRPQEYFAVGALTIADVLAERNALPGRPEDWSAFTSSPRDCQTKKDALGTLAYIPYAAYPTEAKAILGDIKLSKLKLRAWMVLKGYALPASLRDVTPTADQGTVAPPGDSQAKRSRGRPHKTGWGLIGRLVRAAHAENPGTSRKRLAIDARAQAAKEIPSHALPAWTTILKKIPSILAKDPLH